MLTYLSLLVVDADIHSPVRPIDEKVIQAYD